MRSAAVRTLLLSVLLVASCTGDGRSVDRPEEDHVEARIERILRSLRPSQPDGEQPAGAFTLAQRMAFHKVPGVSVAVIHDGQIRWQRGFGEKAAGSGDAVMPDTLFQAASISKPVTALAALRLVDEGALRLDADANEYLTSWKLPENGFTAQRAVTLRDLISHRAGLGTPWFVGYAHGEEVPTLVQVLAGERPANSEPVRVLHTPGERARYSGGGYCVIQQMMEDVTGTTFPVLMNRLVLAPLGMTRSTFAQPLPAALAPAAARGHRDTGECIEGGWHTYPELAAAGLWTTAGDLARFAMGVQAAGDPDALLSPQTAKLLVTRQNENFSLGLPIRGRAETRWFTHNGVNAGYCCVMYGYVKLRSGAVVMTNSDNGMELAREIISAIAEEYDWPEFVPEG